MDCTAGGRELTGLMNYRLSVQKRAEPRSAAPQRRSPGFITLPTQSKTRAYHNGTDVILLFATWASELTLHHVCDIDIFTRSRQGRGFLEAMGVSTR
jgi:hypothetical protein